MGRDVALYSWEKAPVIMDVSLDGVRMYYTLVWI
jgi:hypothetical protein